MDVSAKRMSELDQSLFQATAFERYQEAAELKNKLDDLNAADVVEEIMEVCVPSPPPSHTHALQSSLSMPCLAQCSLAEIRTKLMQTLGICSFLMHAFVHAFTQSVIHSFIHSILKCQCSRQLQRRLESQCCDAVLVWGNTKSPGANFNFLTVCGGLQNYRDALESEDYSTAASLRDQGAAGLPGWWVADSADDPRGHLLRISVGFGRYVGYAYTPQDLAQAEVGSPLLLVHWYLLLCLCS